MSGQVLNLWLLPWFPLDNGPNSHEVTSCSFYFFSESHDFEILVERMNESETAQAKKNVNSVLTGQIDDSLGKKSTWY